MLVELLPRFKGIATPQSLKQGTQFHRLNFCPASRGLRPTQGPDPAYPIRVELLPRFKGIATDAPSSNSQDPRQLNFCPASRGLRQVLSFRLHLRIGLNFCPASRGLRLAIQPAPRTGLQQLNFCPASRGLRPASEVHE